MRCSPCPHRSIGPMDPDDDLTELAQALRARLAAAGLEPPSGEEARRLERDLALHLERIAEVEAAAALGPTDPPLTDPTGGRGPLTTAGPLPVGRLPSRKGPQLRRARVRHAWATFGRGRARARRARRVGWGSRLGWSGRGRRPASSWSSRPWSGSIASTGGSGYS